MKKIKIQDVIDHLVKRVKDGDAFTAIGRDVGNIADNNGNEYTVKIVLSKDEYDLNEGLPLVDDFISDGIGIIEDPMDIFESLT